jgi:hypothetical protein
MMAVGETSGGDPSDQSASAGGAAILGPVRIVYSSTEAPRGPTGFHQFDVGGYQVMVHRSIGWAPSQLQVRLRGRWRPRITVYWDGMPI